MDPRPDNPVVVVGRGNSGTRLLAQTLYASGVFLGLTLNDCGDTVPPEPMYEACQLISGHVKWEGDLRWDFQPLQSMEIDSEFSELVMTYLHDVLEHPDKPLRGWKLPETTLAYPWIVRMFPEARYVHIVRDPRDCLLGTHLTDDLRRWNVDCPDTDDQLEQRVVSWRYQHEIVAATPRPRHFISVRFEDLVLDQEPTLRRLEAFLGIPLARPVVDEKRVNRWKSDGRLLPYVEPLATDMEKLGYGD